MSWIVIDAIDNDRVMQEMHIHVKVHFRKDFMNTPRARMMRDGLLAKLQEVADHYCHYRGLKPSPLGDCFSFQL